LQDPPEFTQIGIFGLKICHLATLIQTPALVLKLTLNPLAAVKSAEEMWLQSTTTIILKKFSSS
jgi:hypothetical protein